jgi:hypothetical protein
MNKQEFIDRTGLTPTDEEYVTIEAIYMAAESLDKNEFCMEYKKHGDSSLVKSLFNEVKELKGLVLATNDDFHSFQLKEREYAIFLVEQAEKLSASDLRDKAIAMLGVKEYLIYKLDRGFNLLEADRQLILKLLE